MISAPRYLNLSVAALIGLIVCARGAQAPQHIDVGRLSQTIENVVVPLPGEVFGALNKLGTVNWKEYVRSNRGSNFNQRPRIALLLGSVIADGFIAVQAEDSQAVKDIGQRVQALAKGINVERSITPHAKAIIEWADKKKWENVRQELDRTQTSVQQAMNELHDEKLSQLVSLGGWLRGTEVLTAVVSKQFAQDLKSSQNGAELLHQPDLLVHFQKQLQGMPEFDGVQVLQEIRGALVEVKPLIDVGDHKISAQSVKKINEITTRLDYAIVTKD
jgi:hypothetical protein